MKSIFAPSRLLLLLSFFTLTLGSSCFTTRRSIAVEEGWELLGEEKVNFVRDADELVVTSRNQFTAIRFLVEQREVSINHLTIHFQNGDKLEPAIDFVVPADQNSRVIELAADGRTISKIAFRYRTTGSILKGRANVLVYGKRYNPGY
jgi:hypothetical protein